MCEQTCLHTASAAEACLGVSPVLGREAQHWGEHSAPRGVRDVHVRQDRIRGRLQCNVKSTPMLRADLPCKLCYPHAKPCNAACMACCCLPNTSRPLRVDQQRTVPVLHFSDCHRSNRLWLIIVQGPRSAWPVKAQRCKAQASHHQGCLFRNQAFLLSIRCRSPPERG